MNKTAKLFFGTLCAGVMAASAAAFAGCGEEKQEITITGSTSVNPLMLKLAAAYEEAHDDVVINISASGSSEGIKDTLNGKNDFAMASRGLKAEETGVVSKKIADDGIALIVNANCTVSDVSAAEIKALYESGTPIQDTIKGAISREAGSGTRDAFEELTKIETLFSGTGFEESNSTSAVITSVSGNAAGNTVGYISMGSLSDKVKALKFNGTDATAANVSNGSYALSRPFNIVYKASSLSEAATAFIDFILSAEGQQIVTANGYIAL